MMIPASIHRFSDPRLYGALLMQPWNKSIQWSKTSFSPIHPKSNLISECFIRVMKLTTGALAIVASSLPALVGRLFQITHYYSLSKDARKKPAMRVVNGMELPFLRPTKLPQKEKFHGSSHTAAIAILRWGFNPKKTAPGAKLGEAVYVSAGDAVSSTYGQDQLILSLSLHQEEVASITNHDLESFKEKYQLDFSNRKIIAAVRKLFYLNGYRAVQYELDHYGKEEAWAIYDPSCISITAINPSPDASYGTNALQQEALLAN